MEGFPTAVPRVPSVPVAGSVVVACPWDVCFTRQVPILCHLHPHSDPVT